MNLVHLATALAVDLGLNRPPAGFQTRLSTDTEQIIYGKSVNVGLQTNEDRRTVLGCYWLSSKYVRLRVGPEAFPTSRDYYSKC